MKDWMTRFEGARQRLGQGDVARARREAEVLLRAAGSDRERADAHAFLGACARRAGDDVTALRHVRAAIGIDPGNAAAHYAHAELLEASKQVPAAIESLLIALERRPGFVAAWFYLGILQGERGDNAAAAASFARASSLDPQNARAWNNLGNALRGLGRLPEAETAFARAVATKKDYGLALANHAKALRDLGRVTEAEVVLRGALAQPIAGPVRRSLLVLLAGVLHERGAIDEAVGLCWEAIQAAPEQSAGEWFQLGWLLMERGEDNKARQAFAHAYAGDRRELRALFGSHLALPMIYADVAALENARAEYERGLNKLEELIDRAVDGLAAADVLDGIRWSNFFLAYQGRDDRALQARYAGVVARAIERVAPEWRAHVSSLPETRTRIRIGFASGFLRDGTVARYFLSWITELPRAKFEVCVYDLRPGYDVLTQAARTRADVFRSFAPSEARPSIVARAIRGDALDLLVYPELGMDAVALALAALRLAPVQWAGWGHPVTTGHDSIDRFLSCALMEPAASAEQYVERVLLLPGIGTRYARPKVPAPAPRSELGLPDDAVLFLCAQSLFKIHPDNDAIFAEILHAHPQCELVFFAGRHPAITDRFMRRLERVFALRGIAIRERTRVLPQMPHSEYLAANLACDAMLDTLHWSGGNTSLDALACGLPVVTLPGAHMRGRQSMGMLQLIGVDELIAHDVADYLAIAGRLAEDASWRVALREHILAAQQRLFDRTDAVVQFIALIEEATRGGAGSGPQALAKLP